MKASCCPPPHEYGACVMRIGRGTNALCRGSTSALGLRHAEHVHTYAQAAPTPFQRECYVRDVHGHLAITLGPLFLARASCRTRTECDCSFWCPF